MLPCERALHEDFIQLYLCLGRQHIVQFKLISIPLERWLP